MHYMLLIYWVYLYTNICLLCKTYVYIHDLMRARLAVRVCTTATFVFYFISTCIFKAQGALDRLLTMPTLKAGSVTAY